MASCVKSVSSKQQLVPAYQIQRHGAERRAIVKCFFIFNNCKFVKFCLFQKRPKILQFMEPGPKKLKIICLGCTVSIPYCISILYVCEEEKKRET